MLRIDTVVIGPSISPADKAATKNVIPFPLKYSIISSFDSKLGNSPPKCNSSERTS